jgi:sugar phosphate isomerase/epimerase
MAGFAPPAIEHPKTWIAEKASRGVTMGKEALVTRRQFAGTTAAATAGLLSGTSPGLEGAPGRRQKAGLKVGLYSITFLGIWYRGEPLPLPEVIRTARQYGYDGIEIDGKRPHGSPLDWPTSRCQELRAVAEGEGIEIYGVAANNDFSSPFPETREAHICWVRDLIRMTSDLGARTLRVFLAWPGVTQHPRLARYSISRDLWPVIHSGLSDEEIWGWCREGLVESARYAGEAGVTLALQNHAPVIRDHRDVLRMVQEVGSPHLKVSLDAPIMPDKSPAAIAEAARAVGSLQVLSHFGGDYEETADGTVQGEPFYRDFIRAMREIGYEGYMSYELCHPLPVVDGQTVGIEYVHTSARLAAVFMRELVQSEYRQS